MHCYFEWHFIFNYIHAHLENAHILRIRIISRLYHDLNYYCKDILSPSIVEDTISSTLIMEEEIGFTVGKYLYLLFHNFDTSEKKKNNNFTFKLLRAKLLLHCGPVRKGDSQSTSHSCLSSCKWCSF